jgi:hypothetical protein
MTFFEWAWARWHTTTVSERREEVEPVEATMPDVAAPYVALHTYLQHRYASYVVLTFEQMEALLGFALPDAARTQQDWWTSTIGDGHSDAWRVARRTATPNLVARTVAFERFP